MACGFTCYPAGIFKFSRIKSSLQVKRGYKPPGRPPYQISCKSVQPILHDCMIHPKSKHTNFNINNISRIHLGTIYSRLATFWRRISDNTAEINPLLVHIHLFSSGGKLQVLPYFNAILMSIITGCFPR